MALVGRKIARHAANFSPDVIHAHFAIPSGWVARSLAAHLQCNYVVSVHGMDLAFTANISLRAQHDVAHVLEDASRVVVNSKLTADGVSAICDRGAQCVRLWQGGDTVANGVASVSDPLRVVSVGHLYPSKGYSESARLLGSLRRQGVRFTWTIVGSGTIADKQRLAEELRANGVDDRCQVIAQLSNEAVLQLLASSDVFLLLTRRDAYGVVFAEAMAAGLLVIGSSQAGAVQDFLEAGAPLYPLSPAFDEADALRLAKVLNDRESVTRTKLAAAEWGRLNLGWAKYVDQLERVYADVLVARGRSTKVV